MNKTTGIIVAIVVVLGLAGIGAFALTKNAKSTTSTSTSTTPGASTPAAPANNTNTPATTDQTAQTESNTIDYTSSGFSPATLTVKVGSTVTIKNSSSGILQFDSNPHPAHTEDPELNVGSISPGKSKTITVTKTGSHGYHNHLNDSDTGILVVE